MKTLTIKEYEKLIKRNDWKHVQTSKVTFLKKYEPQDGVFGYRTYYNHHISGWVYKASTLDDIKIIYKKRFEYDERRTEYLFIELEEEKEEESWEIRGIRVLDDLFTPGKYDGELEHDFLGVLYLSDLFSDIDYDELEYDILLSTI